MRRWGMQCALLLALLAIYAGTYLLWASGHESAYLALVRFWGIDAWDAPFLDLQGVLSWAECHRQGIDVLRTNPCDPLNRPLNYGPILAWLPLTTRDTTWIGVLQSIVFLAAIPLVTRPKDRVQWLVALAAGLSTATLFTLERANLDAVLFVMLATAVAVINRQRVTAYAMIHLGGVIKFYPFALLLIVLRERARTALIGGTILAVAIAAYGVLIWPDLQIIKTNLPPFYHNSDNFGAYLLSYGLVDELRLPRLFGPIGAVVLFAGFGTIAWRLSQRWQTLAIGWDTLDGRFLLAGAIVMTGCFVTQTNLDYRAVFFLFALPGLFALRNANPRDGGIFSFAIGGILFCLWGEFIRRTWHLIAHPPANALPLYFIGRELVWWSVMTIAAALVLTFVRSSPLFRTRPLSP